MKRIALITIIGFLFSGLVAQERIPVELKDLNFTLSILAPSVQLEKSINDKQSIAASFGLNSYYNFSDNSFNGDDGSSIHPMVRADFRNYYPRKRVKKDLRSNSGTYIGLRTGYIFESIAEDDDFVRVDRNNAFFMGAIWGIQRNYQSGIHLGLSLGLGFYTNDDNGFEGDGLGEFRFGFAFGG